MDGGKRDRNIILSVIQSRHEKKHELQLDTMQWIGRKQKQGICHLIMIGGACNGYNTKQPVAIKKEAEKNELTA